MKMGMTKRMVLLIWLGCIFIIAGMYLNVNTSIFIIYNAVVLSLFLLDYKISPAVEDLKIERLYENRFEIGKEKTISLKVTNLGGRDAHIIVKDTPPSEMEHDDRLLTLCCAPGEAAYRDYKVRPVRRGNFNFGSVFAVSGGALGLCTKKFVFPLSETVPVYPDLYPMKKYHLLCQRRLLQQDDSAIHKAYGIGTDFQYLRDYTTDDEYRKINWNATARSHKLITGVYDIEKNQDIIICMDTGRTMLSISGGLSRLDHSVESALVLAQVAIDKGDRAGLLIFGSETKLFLKPAKGGAQLNRIIDALYSLQPDYYESDFNEMVCNIQAYQRKRSLICIFSHTKDEESCKEITASLKPLAQRHAVLMVSILNSGLNRILNKPTEGLQHAYTKAAAAYRLDTEYNASTIMSRLGISNIMVEPNQLTSQVVNRYINMKKNMIIG